MPHLIWLPIAQFDTVFHVGHLNGIPAGNRFSHEGACLSASHHPEEWQRITPLGGPVWRLRKPKARFLNIHKLHLKREIILLERAQQLKLIEPTQMWYISHFDDEMDDTLCSLYPTYAEAAAEAEEGSKPIPYAGYKTTSLLTTIFGHRPTQNFDAPIWAIMALAEMIGLDGVWFNDELDVARYSAPRIGIFCSKLPEFTRMKISLGKAREEEICITASSLHIDLGNLILPQPAQSAAAGIAPCADSL